MIYESARLFFQSFSKFGHLIFDYKRNIKPSRKEVEEEKDKDSEGIGKKEGERGGVQDVIPLEGVKEVELVASRGTTQ